MKKIIFLILMFPLVVHAHGGEDHGQAKKDALPAAAYFSSETVSDKYEVLVKYPPIKPGERAILKLFVSNVNTNQPVRLSTLNISVPDVKEKVVSKMVDNGIYEVEVIFPERKTYSIRLSMASALGADLVQVPGIEAGKDLPSTAITESKDSGKWLFLSFGLLGGAVLMLIVIKVSRRRPGKRSVVSIVLLLLVPLGTARVNAHGGENHDEQKAGGGSLSTAFRVEKETQFLFGLTTEKANTGAFNNTVSFLGTITAGPAGRAVVQSPQMAKIIRLNVRPGQTVTKGMALAIVEQQLDAGTQVDILSQRNTVNAEYQAAKAQYDRLKAIEDIAAKKDVTEARAKYLAAAENKRLLDASAGRAAGSTKITTLTAPISGVVGTFNYAIGAVVNAGETLFEITNLNEVFVEAQVFPGDFNTLKNAIGFSTRKEGIENPIDFNLVMVGQPQTVNTDNQSQRVLFSVTNPNGQLKIGENVTIMARTATKEYHLLLPTEAVTEVNGKPAVFIKDRAEQFSISFITTGQQDQEHVTVLSGVEDGEKIVTRNVYELKMIYLNQ